MNKDINKLGKINLSKTISKEYAIVERVDDSVYNSYYKHFHILENGEIIESVEYRKYRELWRETAVNHLETTFPIHLDIEVTSYCNLLCPFCSRTHRVERNDWENKHMSLDTFKDIIDEGVPMGLKAINLNNYGESLLNKDLCKMIRYAKKKGVIDIMMHTNGTILTEKLSTELMLSGLDQITFSVDSITKEIYEELRVNGKFEKTVSNIRKFATIRRTLKQNKPLIRASMVLMKENAHELDNFAEFWGSDVDSITYTDYHNQDALDKENRYVKDKKGNKSYICPSLWQRMTINVTGEVAACCRDAGKRLEIGRYDKNNKSLLAVWNGETLKNARRLHLNKQAWKLDACRGCDHISGNQPPQ